jgi:hypothetical protein
MHLRKKSAVFSASALPLESAPCHANGTVSEKNLRALDYDNGVKTGASSLLKL